uniref:IMD domain-containing protein n=1 Tax=Timema monikensis TaxID=170555 RepID=A0A7R9EDP8_9NEOP|nr:unnamed protein product [Timema monikensis]
MEVNEKRNNKELVFSTPARMEYKRARAELKKRSTDTLRLQKKAKKGKTGELQRRVECSLQDVSERRHILEETEKHAVKAALIEERSRYCLLVAFLKPVVDEEVAMLSELSHLQEVVDQIQKHTADPYTLPPASEQVIADLKGSDSGWHFQTPPSSPSSLGSRKSSMCSISSLNSSSSGSTKSHQHSPNHHYWHRSLSQQPRQVPGMLRLNSISSQDSGFTSQDKLFTRPQSLQSVPQVSNMSEHSSNSGSNSSNPSTPYTGSNSAGTLPTTTATWPNLQETLQFERAATAIMSDRPHTISSGYERGHQRPPLTVYTFQAPEACHSQPTSPVSAAVSSITINNNNNNGSISNVATPVSNKPQPIYARPPIPQRCSSLERPSVPSKSLLNPRTAVPTPLRQIVMAGSAHHVLLSKTVVISSDAPQQPMYVNMHELASLAASKAQEMSLPPPPPELTNATPDNHEKTEGGEKDGSTSESSLESSSGYSSQTTIPVDDSTHAEVLVLSVSLPARCVSLDVSLSVYSLASASKYCTLPRSGDSALLMNGTRRRPVSATGYTGGTMRSTLLRRGSVQCQKPPPPIRRTASISSSVGPAITLRQQAQQSPSNSLENLPPPPAFLLDTTAAGVPSSPRPPEDNRRTSSGISVADTVRTLTELKHTPASPNSLRRNGSVRSQSADRRGSEATPGLIAVLSAKLAPNLSPRNSRRHSEDLNPGPLGGRLLQRGVAGPGQGFLQALNTKLALQHQQSQQHRATRVRQWINSRTLPDPTICHESLMDQIKRGTTLRRTGTVNDRSAPKIR